MDMQSAVLKFTVSVTPLLSAAYIIIGIILFKHNGKNKVNYFSFLMFACAIYSFGYLLELNYVSLDILIIMRDFTDLGSVFIPAFGILFIAQLAAMKVTKKAAGVLFTVSAVLWLIYITNPVHYLFYRSVDLRIIQGFAVVFTVKGPFYYLMMAYYAFFLIFSGIILAKKYKTSKNKNDKSSFLFVFTAFQLPWFAILIILLGFNKNFDPVPAAIMITCGLLLINEIKNDMFKLRISRWKSDYDIIEDPAFLADEEGIIACSNTAANSLLEEPGFDTGGIIAGTDKSKSANAPFSVAMNNEVRWFSVRKNYYDIKKNYTTYLLIDITEQKLTEKAILKSESRHKAMIAGISDVICVMETDGNIKYISPNVEKHFGWLADDLIGTDGWQIIHPDDTERLQKEFIKILSEDNSSVTVKCRFKCKNGTYKWVELTGTNLVRDKVINGVLLNSHDITDRKRAEDLLTQTRLNYETFFNRIDDFLFVLDDRGRILHTNSTVIERLGYTAEELSGESVLMVHPPERREEAGRIINDMLSGITDFCPIPVVTKAGKKIPVETRISHGIWDNKPAVFGVTKDISKITLSEEKFSKLFYLNPSACGLSDLQDGKYIEVNEAFYNLFGFGKDEVIGRTAMDLGILSGNARETILKNSDADGNVAAIETTLKAKNGEIKHVMLSSENIYVQDIKYRFTVVNDITDNKRKQEQIEFLSYHDQLTGIYNRRYYDTEILRFNEERYYPLTLIMADVNGLKLTNDAFGHKAGDLLLQKISCILKNECRKNDIIARIGGDEFVFLLPETDAENAEIIIDRINTAIKNDNVHNIMMSVSMGYAVKQNNSDDMDEIFMRAEDDMYRHKLTESSSMRSRSIDLIMKSLFEKSNREMMHSRRDGEICSAIAEKMSFTKDEVNEIKITGLMHDIGKIGISDTILNKPAKLNTNEWNEMERHSEIGYRILSSVNEFSQIADYVLEHHEKWDGTGYPKKFKGEEISLQARIIAVADSYDAMTTDRSYRKGLSGDEAAAEIKKCSGTQFDPEIAKVFIEKVLGKDCEQKAFNTIIAEVTI